MTTKTENGVDYPAEAYAYVPDSGDSKTWQLRIWESLDRKTTARQLGRAAAAFSPGGHDGKRADIPDGSRAVVKATLRALYRESDAGASVPHWIQETRKGKAMKEERVSAGAVIELAEDAFDATTGNLTFRIISPGFNKPSKKRYYPKEMLERDHPIFVQRKMFLNHPTRDEHRARPERDTTTDVGQIQETWTEGGHIFARGKVYDPAWRAKLTSMQEAGCLSSQAMSIRTPGVGVKGTIEGQQTMIVEKLIGSPQTSVDFVTMAGAGGGAVMMESEIPDTDVEMINIETLRERRPDLITMIEEANKTNVEPNRTEEKSMSAEADLKQQLEEAQAKITKLEEQDVAAQLTEAQGTVSELQEKLASIEEAEAKATVATEIKETIANVKLPEEMQGLLTTRFSEAVTTDGLKEAIEESLEAFATMSEAGTVKGLGESNAGTNTDATKDKADRQTLVETMTESFSRQGDSPEKAKAKAEAFANAKR